MIPFAFYGTLMERGSRGSAAHAWLSPYGRYGGRCSIPGLLYDLGSFPGRVSGDGVVCGQLWTPHDETRAREATVMFDGIEGYSERDPGNSMYLRRLVRLVEPDGVVAYVYTWNYPLRGSRLIASGDWNERSTYVHDDH